MSESVLLNVAVKPELDVPAVRTTSQPRFRLDLERDVVAGGKILKDDFEIDMKIAGQFIAPTDRESGIIGARFRQDERGRSIVNIHDLCLGIVRMAVALRMAYSWPACHVLIAAYEFERELCLIS